MDTQQKTGAVPQEDVIDLQEIFWALRRKIWLIILAAVIGTGAAGAYSYFMISPTYSSTSLIYIDGGSGSISGAISSLSDLQIGEALTADYSVIIKSRPVLEEVIDNLGLDISYKSLFQPDFGQLPGRYPYCCGSRRQQGIPRQLLRIVNELDEVCIWRIQGTDFLRNPSDCGGGALRSLRRWLPAIPETR